MKENNKRIFAGVATLATLAALAMPGAAMAADADGTITIDAGAGNTLAGHSLTAYRLASYTDAKAGEDGTTLTSVSGNAVDAATEAWLKSALTASGATIKTGDSAASTLMRLTTSSKTLLTVADKLKDTAATSKVTAVKSNVTATTQSTTLTLPEGYYLIVDSEGVPILVSTTVGQATTMGGATLGRTLVKTNTTKILKEVKASDGSWKHNVAVSNGDTRDFRATFTVPSKLSVDTLTITDIMTGMSLVNGSLTLNTVDSKGAATPITPAADYYTTAVDGSKITITGKHKLMEDYEGKQVRIAYKTKITNASKAAAATNTIQVQQNLVPGITPPTTPPPSDKDTASTYDVRLKKVSAANPSTTLQGAQFRIHNDTADTWYTWTESTKQWSAAAGEDKATTFTTDKNGVIDFTNLGAGQYTVNETKVPDGYFSSVKPSFTIKITDEGKITITGKSQDGLTTTVTDADGKTNTVTATVKNIDSLTQLPQTGAETMCILIFGAMAIILLAGVTGFRAYSICHEHLDGALPTA